MKKILLIFMLLFVPMFAYADDVPQQTTKQVDMCANAEQTIKNLNLSQTQADTLRQACTISHPTAETSTWSSNVQTISQAIGLAISDTAKQLNITVNDFVKSPAGIITVAIIVAKMFGSGIIRFVALNALWWSLLWVYLFFVKRAFNYAVERAPAPILWGLWTRMKISKRTYISINNFDENSGWLLFLSSAAFLISTLIIWVNMF